MRIEKKMNITKQGNNKDVFNPLCIVKHFHRNVFYCTQFSFRYLFSCFSAFPRMVIFFSFFSLLTSILPLNVYMECGFIALYVDIFNRIKHHVDFLIYPFNFPKSELIDKLCG